MNSLINTLLLKWWSSWGTKDLISLHFNWACHWTATCSILDDFSCLSFGLTAAQKHNWSCLMAQHLTRTHTWTLTKKGIHHWQASPRSDIIAHIWQDWWLGKWSVEAPIKRTAKLAEYRNRLNCFLQAHQQANLSDLAAYWTKVQMFVCFSPSFFSSTMKRSMM